MFETKKSLVSNIPKVDLRVNQALEFAKRVEGESLRGSSGQPNSTTVAAMEEARMMPNPTVESSDKVAALLAERGSRYGSFNTHAKVTQAFKLQCAEALKDSRVVLSPSQQESLDMIFHKIGRIVNGDPNYVDSWDDIAGYATLVSDELRENESKGGAGH